MSLEQITQTLNQMGEKTQAVSLLNTFARHAWQFPEYDDLAKCFFRLKLYTDSIRYSELALTTAYTMERSWSARANLINVLNHANYPERAMKYIHVQERLLPEDQDTRLEKAFSLFLLNKRDAAEAILQKELLRDDLSDETRTKILFNLGTYCLWRDEFQKGLRLFLLKGEELNYWRKAKLPFRFWEGGIMPGRTIILYSEAGIGDEIINVRFMRHLERVGMKPIWFTDRQDMAELFNANGYTTITSKNDIKKLYDADPDLLWTYPMSLPVYLDLQYKDLWHGPYLKSLPEYNEKHSDVLNETSTKIGLRWQGNAEYDQDLHRSVPLAAMFSVAMTVNANMYSLQRDTGLEEIGSMPIVDLSDRMVNFCDTISLINKLNVVITSCTSIAHAAAAMGKRVFVMVPISAYYTWSHSSDQSPWYGENVTILRQESPRDWTEPLKRLRVCLSKL